MSEQVPVPSHDESQSLLHSSHTSPSNTSPNAGHVRRTWLNHCLRVEARLVICTLIIQFLISFAKHVIEVPLIRLVEMALCNRYYRSPGKASLGDHRKLSAGSQTDEKLCKLPSIQDELALLIGWRFFFDALAGLLTALFYGRVADRVGRRPVLSLSCVGLLCSFGWILLVCYNDELLPVRLAWASSVFILLGGGHRIAKSMVFVILADVFGQPERTRYMYLLAAIPHLTTIIAPLFANLLMNIDIWIPFVIAMGALFLASIVVWVMPEPLRPAAKIGSVNDVAHQRTPLLRSEHCISSHEALQQEDRRNESDPPPPFCEAIFTIFHDVLALTKRPELLFCLLLFLLRPVALLSRSFIYQHASESFNWPMSHTTLLRVAEAVGSSSITLAILPLLSAYLDRKDHDAKLLDLNVIRGSLLVAAIGFAMLWQSKTSWMLALGLFITGLGEGLEPSLKGLATSLIDISYNARLLTLVAVLEVLGKLAGGPLMARLFSIGRSEHHGSSGINFLVASVIFVVLTVAALLARLKR